MRLLAVDYSEIYLRGIATCLEQRADYAAVSQRYSAGRRLVRADDRFDGIVVGLRGSNPEVVEALRELRASMPAMVIVMADSARPLLREVLDMGIRCVVSRGCSCEMLLMAVDAAAAGRGFTDDVVLDWLLDERHPSFEGCGLTAREAEVADLLAAGLPKKQIAAQLFVSLNTVKFHAANVYAKLGVRSCEELTHVRAELRRGQVLAR